MKVRDIKNDEIIEIDKLSNEALNDLGLFNAEDILGVLKRMNDKLNKLRDTELSKTEFESLAYQFGSLFGIIIQKKYKWKWIYVEEGKYGDFCVSSLDDRFCCPVHNYIYSILTKEINNNSKLLFNLIEDIHLDGSKGKYNYIV
ncbi:MAG: hypothetical protein AB9834_01755 [Lentimicrobium sp.]